MKSLRILRIFLAGIIFPLGNPAQAQLINVDFNNDSFGAANGGPSVGPTMSGAAVLGSAGDQWNAISANTGSNISLNYADGTASPVTMTFTSGGGYDVRSFSGSTPLAGTPYDALVEDYIVATANTFPTITLSGLATNATYQVVLYNAADSAAAGRITYFSINPDNQDYRQAGSWDGTNSALSLDVDYADFPSVLSDASGNLVIMFQGTRTTEGDINGFQIQPVAPLAAAQTNINSAYTWTTLAGRSLTGSQDGVGSAVQFGRSAGVAVNSATGDVYVTDSVNSTIRKITRAGVSSTIAGFAGNSGTNDGVGSNARFFDPEGIAMDNSGNLYVADTDNNRIRKMTPVGTNWMVTTIAGSGSIFAGNCDSCPPSGGYVDGPGTNAQFNLPQKIALDSAGNIYVTDGRNALIRELKPVGTNGWVVSTVAAGTTFQFPYGIAVDTASNLYVADASHILKITPNGGSWTASVLAGSTAPGYADGTGTAAKFSSPKGLVLDAIGNIYVTDGIVIRKITSAGVVTTLAGSSSTSGSSDGTGTSALFSSADGVGLDAAGNLYVADYVEIRKITSAGVVATLAGFTVPSGSTDGTGDMARFNFPGPMAADSAGNIYVADGGETIRIVSPAGEVTTIAGTAGAPGTNDGVGNNARFTGIGGIAVNNSGTLYVVDNDAVRLVTQAGVVTTIAGAPGVTGSADGVGSAARFNGPGGIAVNNAGIIFVSDTRNNTIRKVTPRSRFIGGQFITTWTVTTIAGSASNPLGCIDGLGAAAQFDTPEGLTVDANGNIYVADFDNEAIREIDTNDIVTTVAGLGFVTGNADGVGSNARFLGPAGLTEDGLGNLYVADQFNSTIRKVSPVGSNWVVITVGGLAGDYASADGAGSASRFNQPVGIAVDSAGNLYVSDSDNNTIRKGTFTAFSSASQVAFLPPAMNGSLQVTLLPGEAGGQWRFPWEIGWHNSGDVISNLASGNYEVDFRSQPGWLPIPSSLPSVQVTPGDLRLITNQYFPTAITGDTNSMGSLTVNLGPSPPLGAGWRFLGDTGAFFPSGYTTNLVPGTYLIQFQGPFSGRATPPNLSVQVSTGLPTILSENYPLAAAAPQNVILPIPVPPASIRDVANFPFGFNGQLQSDTGFGSGVAVETNVVLTAAHLVFNDQTLAYVSQVYWYFQEETGISQPQPIAARGWYVLGGYATERTTNLLSGLYGPDESTPESRNLDVAAVYFYSPVADGGYGGYLPSDDVPNPWLTGDSLKMLVGYPVDGSQFGDASILPGLMYQTAPQPFPLSLATDPVNEQQKVYLAPWFLSYPGNSGGPVYAQFNGYYYPAGIYLGTLYSGNTPYASLVRAIDSEVVGLITNAAVLGDSGTNHTGGGVVTVVANQTISASQPGFLQFQIQPAAAVAAGAAWRLQGDSAYSTSSNYTRAVSSTNAVIEFKSVPGWNLPANQAVALVPGNISTFRAFYTVVGPMLVANSVGGIGLTGTTGTVYQIQSRPSLMSGGWTPMSTNTITNSGFNEVVSGPLTNAPVMFYRAVWLP
ncbi:MAG TPA: NHL repeat-containing protein [Verrucomicrobiae bacterium]|jgi:sugar lactone lactonase YvrE|nr:NHL repeat-containing protein [Verrucomicrobiae bacterium]